MNTPNADALLHVRGESRYIDDQPEPRGCLHAIPIVSPVARGGIRRLDCTAVRAHPGVVTVLTAGDIPGRNQIGGVIEDEPLLAEHEVHFAGQPIALVVADRPETVRAAAKAARLEITPEPPVLDSREARRRGELIAPPRAFSCGDVDAVWASCAVVVEGRVESGAQEHVYLETQGALADLREDGGIRILSATQAPSSVQRIVARVLGLPMHRIEVEAPRLGGAFGGKEDQATIWAALAALAAFRLRHPVKIVLRRGEDLRWTGKRHPYSSDYRLGLSADGRLLAYEVVFHQNSGAAADLSTAILERTLFHATGSYYIPNVRATGYCCRTNLPPNTAFRGFGAPQAAFVMECALCHAARRIGVDAAELQSKNLLSEGDAFPFGMTARRCMARRCWDSLESTGDLARRREEVARFNATHRLEKKGLALMPVCFGISFTTTFLNQASALVHLYLDGSVGVSTAAVEMGQGVHTKIRGVAARVLGIDPAAVRLEATSTLRAANASPTAASSGADLNGHAVRLACETLRRRLLAAAAARLGLATADSLEIRDGRVFTEGRDAGLVWDELIDGCYRQRVSLSAQAHYATPDLHFDRRTEQGEPFAYHAYGAALIEATVDILRGTGRIDAVWLVHDAGQSLHPLIDRGQIEGGLAQGLGWMTVEEIRHSPEGRLLTDTLTTYKLPDLLSAPAAVDCRFLEDSPNPAGPFHSKAIGEPPFLYGIGAFFALQEAMRAYRPDLPPVFVAPLTNERIFMTLWGGDGAP